jgi:hypothetical protein
LTGQNRPLYSAGFAAPALSLVPGGPCGGTGRRARLKIEFRKECWFDSGQGHQKLFRRHPLQSGKMRACAKAAQINANVINGVLAIWPRTVRETAGRRC